MRSIFTLVLLTSPYICGASSAWDNVQPSHGRWDPDLGETVIFRDSDWPNDHWLKRKTAVVEGYTRDGLLRVKPGIGEDLEFRQGVLDIPTYQVERSYIKKQVGNCAVVISIPHGGNDPLYMLDQRNYGVIHPDREKRPTNDCNWNEKEGKWEPEQGDKNSEYLGWYMAAEMERLGKKPYVVQLLADRPWVDANRRQDRDREAYRPDDWKAKRVYDQYHQTLADMITHARDEYRQMPLVIDVHGIGGKPRKDMWPFLVRGTAGGSTMREYMNAPDSRNGMTPYGEDVVTGPRSWFQLMVEEGYRAWHTDLTESREAKDGGTYNGGSITRFYGHADGVNAMQIEVGRDLRDRVDDAKRTGLMMGSTMVSFLEAYPLPEADPDEYPPQAPLGDATQ